MKAAVTRHRILLGIAGLLALAILVIAAYASYWCIRADRVRKSWDQWTSELSGPPPWATPSNDLHAFRSSSTFVANDGLTYTLKGYKDAKGAVVIEPRFVACAKRFYEGLAWAYEPKTGTSGYINPDGTWAFVVAGSVTSDFSNGMARIRKHESNGDTKFGYVDTLGNVVVSPRYQIASHYVDGYALVEENTWLGSLADRLAAEFYFGPSTCWNTKPMILDRHGTRVSLPSRSRERDNGL